MREGHPLLLMSGRGSAELRWEGHHKVKVRRPFPHRDAGDLVVEVWLPLRGLKFCPHSGGHQMGSVWAGWDGPRRS